MITPKQNQAIAGIIGGANPQFFSYLAKLLGIPTAITKEEKEKQLKFILEIWKARNE